LVGVEMAGVVRVAEEGTYVYFVSHGELAGNLDAKGEPAKAGADNLYVYDTSTRATTFIGALAGNDLRVWGGSDERRAQATPDGRFLLFASTGDLTPDASGPGRQLYRYEVPSEAHSAGTLVRVTIGEDGYNDNGNSVGAPSSLFAPAYKALIPKHREVDLARPQPVSISENGAMVFFASPLALTPQAHVNDVCAIGEGACPGEGEGVEQNVYEWEDGQVYLISDGQDTHSVLDSSATTLIGANASGSDVFFQTADPLVAQDTDTQQDVYDASVNGGFPTPVVPAGCEGETCQAPPSTPPTFDASGSATFSGVGDLVSPAPVKKVVVLSHAQKLARALKACKRLAKRRRVGCEKVARERYGGRG
jgi:hypothetical protein